MSRKKKSKNRSQKAIQWMIAIGTLLTGIASLVTALKH